MSEFAAFGVVRPRAPVPPELESEAALLAHLGISAAELRKIWFYRSRMYHRFDIPKRSGGSRTITAPDNRLKMIQRKLLALLEPLYQRRRPVHGFVEDRSVLSNAEAHLKRRYVLNVDLKDFFPSITEARVAGVLRSFGLAGRVADVVARLICVDGYLPQGAPTSPLLSNMICFRLDKRLMAFAREARCIYTRYADDITISGVQPPTPLFEGGTPAAGRLAPDLLAESFRRIIEGNGFALHPEKLHYADRNSRRTVTGVKINEFPNVDRRYVRDLRAALHCVATLGFEEAQKSFEEKHGGRPGVPLASHLQGRIAWVTFVKGQADPVVRALTTRYNACFPERPLKVEPTLAQKRERSVWVVDNDETIEQGSAFFVEGVGLVTAAHCVRDATEVEIYHPSKASNKFTARVLRTSEARDLALLEHDLPPTEFFELKLRSEPVAQGDHVSAVGYPGYGPGDGLNVRTGTVSSLPVRNGVSLVEVTQTLTPGMSGGPVLLSDEVVGIVHKGGPGEGRNFAIDVRMLNEWLEEEGADVTVPQPADGGD